MTRKANSIPDGHHTATTCLCITNASRAIDYYKQVFGATEQARHADPDGKIRHAEIRIGDTPFMLFDEYPEISAMRSVQTMGGSPVSTFLYVDDADAVAERAVAAGATWFYPMKDQPYGRSGGVQDPFGLVWWITTPPTLP